MEFGFEVTVKSGWDASADADTVRIVLLFKPPIEGGYYWPLVSLGMFMLSRFYTRRSEAYPTHMQQWNNQRYLIFYHFIRRFKNLQEDDNLEYFLEESARRGCYPYIYHCNLGHIPVSLSPYLRHIVGSFVLLMAPMNLWQLITVILACRRIFFVDLCHSSCTMCVQVHRIIWFCVRWGFQE